MNKPQSSTDIVAALSAAALELAIAPHTARVSWLAYLLEDIEAQDADAPAGTHDYVLRGLAVIIALRIAHGRW